MVRRRARRALKRAIRHRTNTIPVVDVLHGIYTLDGFTNGQASTLVKDGVGLMTGTTGTNKIENDINAGVTYVTSKPKEAIIGGIKNFAVGHVARKVAGLFLPRSAKLFGKWRIQLR